MAGALGISALGIGLALRPAAAAAADPPLEVARDEAAAGAAIDAAAALDRVAAVIATAGDAARSGSALIISGVDPPEPPLLEAAGDLEDGASATTTAGTLVARLTGMRAAIDPGSPGAVLELSAAELTGIASQLRASAPVATAFVARRHAAEQTLAELGAALAALTRDEPARAADAIERARAAREEVAAWEAPPSELAVWLETTGDMLTAARAIADALAAGDAEAAKAAGDAYSAAAQRAAVADRALALAIAEAGSAITIAPLQRLARAADQVAAVRNWVASAQR